MGWGGGGCAPIYARNNNYIYNLLITWEYLQNVEKKHTQNNQ